MAAEETFKFTAKMESAHLLDEPKFKKILSILVCISTLGIILYAMSFFFTMPKEILRLAVLLLIFGIPFTFIWISFVIVEKIMHSNSREYEITPDAIHIVVVAAGPLKPIFSFLQLFNIGRAESYNKLGLRMSTGNVIFFNDIKEIGLDKGKDGIISLSMRYYLQGILISKGSIPLPHDNDKAIAKKILSGLKPTTVIQPELTKWIKS